ncbi:hypothetical protein B0H63DRAFT_487344 [Podospora didyma]|uniref:Heterokaryon incompatibility domain-containing protein n=1 Tax=Podospora didyma TaxID=330526 RepID=A0AAE0K6R9_9PEZI|nr:hypothetical protein B0H63DRAFT_487344 [Podospora didyma]
MESQGGNVSGQPQAPHSYLDTLTKQGREEFEARFRTAEESCDIAKTGEDVVVLQISREFGARTRKYPGNGGWLCAAIIATERALETAQLGDAAAEARGECLLSLGDLYGRRSQWSGPVSETDADLNKAISLVESALQSITSPETRGPGLQQLSALFEDRYIRHHMAQDIESAVRRAEEASLLAVEDRRRRELDVEVICLKFKGGDISAIPCVVEVPFEQISEEPVSLDAITPCRYRFLDCRSFADRTSLRVLELDDLPHRRYVAISYVWRGLPHPAGTNPGPIMSIEGASNADPISIEVLRLACVASLKLGCELVWLDGLCIMQGHDGDKSWQIQRMYGIYQFCKACLVLPGGLSRLVAPEDETAWIHRAWTLQEAVAPNVSWCLFFWPHGDCFLQSLFPAYVREVEPKTAAMAGMQQLLMVSMRDECEVKFPSSNPASKRVLKTSVRLLADTRRDPEALKTLIAALDTKGREDEGREGMAITIWRGAMMRTAYRPVDTILSIMGIFGVNLDPNQFSADDRHGATIALMRGLLNKGERAEWLGMAPTLDPGKELSTLPIVPTRSTSGRAYRLSKEGGMGAASHIYWWIRDTPKGSMDIDGVMTILASVVSVRLAMADSGNLEFESCEKQKWEVLPSAASPPYAAVIGKRDQFRNGSFPRMGDLSSNFLLLVDGQRADVLRVVGYAAVRDEVVGLPQWSEMALCIR